MPMDIKQIAKELLKAIADFEQTINPSAEEKQMIEKIKSGLRKVSERADEVQNQLNHYKPINF